MQAASRLTDTKQRPSSQVPFSVSCRIERRILELADHPDDVRWLPGARFNIAEAALCNRGADATAVVWADESAPSQLHKLSLGQLKLRCQAVAAALRAEGFAPGGLLIAADAFLTTADLPSTPADAQPDSA